MDYENMTLRDFVEFAEVYPYTQDRYLIEKMFMELDLIQLHLESYDFILGSNNISSGQMDVLMVESGVNDASVYTEKLFLEKSFNILHAIGKLFKMIGHAISTLFRGIGKAFGFGNSKLSEQEKRDIERMKALETVDVIATSTGAGLAVKQTASDIALIAGTTGEEIKELAENIDNNIAHGGARIIPITINDPNNAIRFIDDVANKLTGTHLTDKQLDIMYTMMQSDYEVEGPALISDLENISSWISDLIDLSDDTKTASHITYDTAKTMHKTGADYGDRVKEICSRLEEDSTKPGKFKLNESMLKQKIKTANELNEIFTKIAQYTDIGETDLGNKALNFLNRATRDRGEQQVNRREADNNGSMRVDSDEDFHYNPGIKGALRPVQTLRGKWDAFVDRTKFKDNYNGYLNSLHLVAVKMQTATAEMSKALTAHINLRNRIIEAHIKMSDAVGEAINEAQNKSQQTSQQATV